MVSVLIVERAEEIRHQAERALHELGYQTETAESFSAAAASLETKAYQVVIADMNEGACELCAFLRGQGNGVPFIALAEAPSAKEKRMIFRAGADGYLTLPFDSEELQLRLKNLLWRCKIESSAMLQYGNCRLRADIFGLEAGDRTIELRHMEFLLLEKLLSYPGRIFTRNQLMDELWGYDCESNPRTVDSHIRQIRKKLRSVSEIRIQTIRGIGYRAAVPKSGRNEGNDGALLD